MEKFKKIVKENVTYFIVFLCLILLTISLFVSKNHTFDTEHMPLQLDTYEKVIISNIIVEGIIYFFLLNLAKKRDFKLENIFLIMAIPIGIAYIIALPIGTIPDDQTHYLRSWEVSLGYQVSEQSEDGDGGRELPINLSEILFNVGTHNYEEYFQTATDETLKEEMVFQWFSNASLYSVVCYLPQAFGIAFARIFTDNLFVMAYSARICNFAVFIVLVYFSVKIIPFKKMFVTAIALMPIVFQEAVSVSPDAITIAISMMLISYTLHLKYSDKNITKKNIIILTFLSVILSLCKIVYIPICFIIYTISCEKFKNKKQKYLLLTSIILIAIIINLLWLSYASRYLIEYNEGVNSKEQIRFILTNPIDYMSVVIKMLINRSDVYISNILGDLSLLNVSLSPIFKSLLFIILISIICLNDSKNCKVNSSTRIIISCVIISVIALIFTSLYVQWNPVKNIVIEGVQGRYFIPILILTPYLFNNSYFVSDKKMSARYLLMFMMFLNFHAISYISIVYK